MLELNSVGKVLMIFGAVLFVLGGLFLLGGKIPWVGRLPGDIYVQKKNFIFFFPIATSILLSLALSVILLLLRRR
ncbi:MAG: hypothetical protein A3C51_06520 [Omnitrophica bacterium RIFCSPHIGHO2_02_FULL_46_20]|nr:MAG: hypothetical protein A3C51_06520 [Omnitrophica bacterium RIFCSPHIGHO2_02_FULL_46_20]OGW93305.1 MAG: hypothetical protein A3G36_06475 [Omnitrophica bacterium RIFCSPLOWO2_12_FULL_45_13]